MKPALLLACFALFCTLPAAAQNGVLLVRDDGTPAKAYAGFSNWEETVMFVPEGPCRVVEVRVVELGEALCTRLVVHHKDTKGTKKH